MKYLRFLTTMILFAGILGTGVAMATGWDHTYCVLGVLALQFIPVNLPYGVAGSFIKALTGVSGGDTVITEDDVRANILIGTTDLDLVITKLALEISGRSTINVTGQTVIQALSKYLHQALLGADVKVAQMIPLATGAIPGQKMTLTLTQTGTTTPNVYGFSDNGAKSPGSPVYAGQQTINQSSNLALGGFTALIFDETNLDYVDIVFADGWRDKLTAVELHALFASRRPSDADGKLAGLTVIDNSPMGNVTLIRSATIYATSGGSITVTRVDI